MNSYTRRLLLFPKYFHHRCEVVHFSSRISISPQRNDILMRAFAQNARLFLASLFSKSKAEWQKSSKTYHYEWKIENNVSANIFRIVRLILLQKALYSLVLGVQWNFWVPVGKEAVSNCDKYHDFEDWELFRRCSIFSTKPQPPTWKKSTLLKMFAHVQKHTHQKYLHVFKEKN